LSTGAHSLRNKSSAFNYIYIYSLRIPPCFAFETSVSIILEVLGKGKPRHETTLTYFLTHLTISVYWVDQEAGFFCNSQ